MSKRILILSANPKQDSLGQHLAQTYAKAAKQNHHVRLIKLSELDFNPDLSGGYASDSPMEPALVSFQDAITWCNHLVIVTPIWWGSLPAKLKGLIDRTFLPGFAFQYEKGKLRPKKCLTGKTARIIMTMDTPPWYYKLIQGAPAVRQLKQCTLEFVGLTQVKSTMFGPVISATERSRSSWHLQVETLGHLAK